LGAHLNRCWMKAFEKRTCNGQNLNIDTSLYHRRRFVNEDEGIKVVEMKLTRRREVERAESGGQNFGRVFRPSLLSILTYINHIHIAKL
jgi:hypothetical protein